MGLYPCNAVSANYVAQLVRANFPQSYWDTMVAIAYAESTFYPCAISGGGSIGLWQVKPTSANMTETQLLDPMTNAQAAAYVLLRSSSPGLQNWGSYVTGAYQQFLSMARSAIAATAPPVAYVAPVITISPTFGVSGTASVTSGGRILGTLRLVAVHGSIPYRVTMSVSPGYGSSYPLSTVASGTATPGTTNINQSLLAPLPSQEIIRTYQQQHSGPVAFAYTVNWSVMDPNTGQSKTVSGGQRVTLTVQ